MSILGLLLVVVAVNTWLLLRVWKRQRARFGGFVYTRDDDPFNFWLSIVIIALSLLWWTAMAALVAISMIWGPLGPD